jgi:hypothetical protein
MQVISNLDKIFISVYALLIPLVGTLVFWISGQATVLLFVPLLLAIYLGAALKKPLRRRRAAGILPRPG